MEFSPKRNFDVTTKFTVQAWSADEAHAQVHYNLLGKGQRYSWDLNSETQDPAQRIKTGFYISEVEEI